MRTGYYAMRLAIVLYILPFMFVYTPELILIGKPLAIVIRIVFVTLGVYALVAAVEEWFRGVVSMSTRVGLGVSSCLLFFPSIYTYVLGTLLFGALFYWQSLQRSRVPVSAG
jgi:TRAP-type uncharacterized transport system fused permease subunit